MDWPVCLIESSNSFLCKFFTQKSCCVCEEEEKREVCKKINAPNCKLLQNINYDGWRLRGN